MLESNQIRVITPNTEYTYTVPTQPTSQLEALRYIIYHTKKYQPPAPLPKRITKKWLREKHGIVGMGAERCISAIKMGQHKPTNGGTND